MRQRLSVLDASFLEIERPETPLVIGRALLFAGPAPGFDRFLEHVKWRLPLVPRLTQRLTPVPLRLGRPEWNRDPGFRLRDHVRAATLRPPGGEAELRSLCEEVYPRPLEPSSPPWELCYVEGLEGERFAVIARFHHSMVDGGSMMYVLGQLFPDEESESSEPQDRATPARRTTPAAVAVRAAREGMRKAWRAAAGHVGGQRPGPLLRGDAREVAGAARLLRERGDAPSTRLGRGSPGPRRTIDWVAVPLSELRATKDVLETTLNSLALAVVTGTLRRYLGRHGEADERLVAMVPTSGREESDAHLLGNRVVPIHVELPVEEADPAVRLSRIAASVAEARSGAEAGERPPGGAALDTLLELWPPALRYVTRRNYGGSFFNITVTNVIGPASPLRCCGRPLEAIFPLLPLTPRQAVTIGLFTALGTAYFGITADPDRLPDARSLTDDVRAALAELEDLARAGGRAEAR